MLKGLLLKLAKLPKWLLILSGILIAIRLTLEPAGRWAINKFLSEKLGNYTGRIEDLDISLLRVAGKIEGLEIKRKDSNLPPIVNVNEAEVSLAWQELFQGRISSNVEIDRSVVRLTDASNAEKKQLGTEFNWRGAVKKIPVSIERLSLSNSAVYFSNSDLKEPVTVSIEDIQFDIHDIHLHRKENASTIAMEGILQGHSTLKMRGTVNLFEWPPRADIDHQLVGFKPNTLNKLLLAYVPLDITRGELSMYAEVATANKEAIGYAKIFFKDGDIIAPKQNIKNARHLLFEFLSAFGNWLIKNNDSKKVATFIPFEYKSGILNIDNSEAFWSSIKNMSESIKPGIENKIDMKSLETRELPKYD